jgi:hypothetical protein
MIRSFANELRESVDRKSEELHVQGERILRWLDEGFFLAARAAAATGAVGFASDDWLHVWKNLSANWDRMNSMREPEALCYIGFMRW